MGFWQNLVDSYDKNADALMSQYPLSTTTISNNGDMIIVIIIDGEGNFIKSEIIEKAKKDKTGKDIVSSVQICIPVTENSMGRSSGVAAHPVFDQYAYLQGSGNKFKKYLAELKGFATSEFAPPQVKAIYQYIDKRSVKKDLKVIDTKDKTNIVFKVEILGNKQIIVWEDEAFFDAWHQYYLREKKKKAEKKKLAEKELTREKKLTSNEKKKLNEQAKLSDAELLDYISGSIQPVATSHPKKIINRNKTANAKLISDNDNANFTFRGKFENSLAAFSVGYESSQKAHQFLRYLVNDRGYYCGEQVILSYMIGSTEKQLPPPIDEKSIWDFLNKSQVRTESDKQIALRAKTGIDYADALRKSLAGFGYGKTLEKHAKTAVVALDAATTGRLSITFYRELSRDEYIESIADWHSDCKWNQQFGSAKNQRMVFYTGAPSVDKIIAAVYGKPRGNTDASYTKIKKSARERLLRCIFDKALLPRDYITAAVRRASNPLAVTANGKFDRKSFEQLLSTTCALLRKDYQQHNKEDYKLSIELDRTDRDYLYGRLLGAADKLEEHAIYKKDKDRVVTATAAIRHMQAFAQRPFRTWQTIHSCLNPYIQAVKGDFAFQEIEAIKNKFTSVSEYQNDSPLNGTYLIGYYHERDFIDNLVKEAHNKKQTIANNEKENDNDRQ